MRSINTFIIGLIIVIAFTQGLVSLVGPSESFMRTIREILIILLFIFSVIQSWASNNGSSEYRNKQHYLGKYYIFSIFIVAIISKILNETSDVEFFLFFLRIGPPILFFWAMSKVDFNEDYVMKILKFMVILQIPAIIVKYVVIGVSESGGIGTMAIHAGSLSTIFPLSVISFAFAFYLSRRSKKYLAAVLVYLIFGLIGGKRALIVYTPVVFVVVFIIYNRSFYVKHGKSFVKQLMFIFIGCFVSFYFIARFNPNLNPEEKIGGSFDIAYIIDISTEYNSFKGELGFSRTDAPEVLYSFLTSRNNISALFFGMGPGDIIQSSLNNKYPGVENDRQLLMYKYGLGYGLRVGVLWTAIQVGLIGALLYGLFFLKVVRNTIAILKNSKNAITKEYSLGVIGMGFILLMDYFTYSSTYFYSGAISNSFFLLLVVVMKRYAEERSDLVVESIASK